MFTSTDGWKRFKNVEYTFFLKATFEGLADAYNPVSPGTDNHVMVQTCSTFSCKFIWRHSILKRKIKEFEK